MSWIANAQQRGARGRRRAPRGVCVRLGDRPLARAAVPPHRKYDLLARPNIHAGRGALVAPRRRGREAHTAFTRAVRLLSREAPGADDGAVLGPDRDRPPRPRRRCSAPASSRRCSAARGGATCSGCCARRGCRVGPQRQWRSSRPTPTTLRRPTPPPPPPPRRGLTSTSPTAASRVRCAASCREGAAAVSGAGARLRAHAPAALPWWAGAAGCAWPGVEAAAARGAAAR